VQIEGKTTAIAVLVSIYSNEQEFVDFEEEYTLSDSLAKNTVPLPTPRVPFFFFPFLSISDTAQV
jgi:hypothetical protein